MNSFTVHPSQLTGKITIPPSKSHSQRALLFASKGLGTSKLQNLLSSPDITAMQNAIEALGATCTQLEDCLEVTGGTHEPTEPIDAGNSGQVLRFIAALAALNPHYVEITGDVSIRKRRPIKPLMQALRQLGALAESANGDGHPPLILRGPIHSGICRLNGEDSQPVSALLMATSFLNHPTEIFVDNPGETPWIDLTLEWLQRMGSTVTHSNYSHYRVSGGLSYSGFHYTVPGDFSSAAFPIAAALLTQSSLSIAGLSRFDIQGDRILLDHLQEMGAKLQWQGDQLEVYPSSLKGIEIDVNACIDALPILAVIGCYAEGETRLYNGAIARFKESDRIHAIATELKKMGANIVEEPDGLVIRHSPLHGAQVSSHRDHRIALSLTVAALGANEPTQIEGANWITKSYPTFLDDMQHAGAKIELDLVRV